MPTGFVVFHDNPPANFAVYYLKSTQKLFCITV